MIQQNRTLQVTGRKPVNSPQELELISQIQLDLVIPYAYIHTDVIFCKMHSVK